MGVDIKHLVVVRKLSIVLVSRLYRVSVLPAVLVSIISLAVIEEKYPRCVPQSQPLPSSPRSPAPRSTHLPSLSPTGHNGASARRLLALLFAPSSLQMAAWPQRQTLVMRGRLTIPASAPRA